MVPTEEERLPVRVPISVRGLSAINFFHGPALRRSLPFASLSYSFFSHFASRWSCFKQGRSLNEHTLFFYQTILLFEFPLLRSTSSVYVLRSMLAGHSYMIINSISAL